MNISEPMIMAANGSLADCIIKRRLELLEDNSADIELILEREELLMSMAISMLILARYLICLFVLYCVCCFCY